MTLTASRYNFFELSTKAIHIYSKAWFSKFPTHMFSPLFLKKTQSFSSNPNYFLTVFLYLPKGSYQQRLFLLVLTYKQSYQQTSHTDSSYQQLRLCVKTLTIPKIGFLLHFPSFRGSMKQKILEKTAPLEYFARIMPQYSYCSPHHHGNLFSCHFRHTSGEKDDSENYSQNVYGSNEKRH